MDLSNASVWWVAAGVAVAAELGTGTFYLLMIALGLVAGAMAAHFGLAESAQFLVAAFVGGGATVAWHWRRRLQRGPAVDVTRDRDVHLDVGERVHVSSWAADRTARVRYRGSMWSARLAPGADAVAGDYAVAAVEGIWLVLAPAAGRAQP
ncbi:MAG TPA: NfeD family protein [Caldimonas sp.]|jgi:membrane protein implicated in regulation of membrane protease activity